MAISMDWGARLVLSTASITDIVEFKDEIRALEESAVGVLYPAIISYKRLDLGGGAYFHGVDFINSYQLKFPDAGNYTVIGNIGATIVPIAGVFVDRTKSAAFTTISAGASGLTQQNIRDAMLLDSGVNASIDAKIDAAIKAAKLAAALSA
jgi:hypothetical protein